MKISQFKQNLQIIIKQIEELKAHRDTLINNDHNLSSVTADIANCKQKLEESFSSTESQSMNKLTSVIKKRKSKRALRTPKLKMKKKQVSSSSHNLQKELHSSSPQETVTTLKKHQLRSATKYLETIDCIEKLHQLNGGEDACKLRESLNPIKSIWQSTLDSIRAEEQSLTSAYSQWNEILFGVNLETDMKCGLKDLIERRCIWDSYLDESNGSHIPVGWVYPKQDARPNWKQYQA